MNIKKLKPKQIFEIGRYFFVVLFSLLFLYVGNKIATRDFTIFNNAEGIETVEANVTKIVDVSENEVPLGDDSTLRNTDITFEAKITKGARKNETVLALQNLSSLFASNIQEVTPGSQVILSSYTDDEWYFIDYIRINKLLIFGGIFIVLLLIFGRMKGFNAILSLCFTCVSIFAVFIPALLSGKNIYISSMVVCVYSTIVTLFMVNGINKKSFAAVTGCFGGIATIALLTFFMGKALELTGLINEEAQFLLYLPTENPIDLRAIIFAAIVIGAVGAIMDVAMSISSSLWEVNNQGSDLTFKTLFESGINIGKDVMGTMINTLVLAYIGSSLSVVLLLTVYSTSFIELVNRELVIVELLQALVGSFGILLTMPLTSLICAALYSLRSIYPDDYDSEKYS